MCCAVPQGTTTNTFDEIGNYMEYSLSQCFAVYGHLTPQQIMAAHNITSRQNPAMYNWGELMQYRANVYCI